MTCEHIADRSWLRALAPSPEGRHSSNALSPTGEPNPGTLPRSRRASPGNESSQGQQRGWHQNGIGRHETGNRDMRPTFPTEVQNDFLRVLNLGGEHGDGAASKPLAFDIWNRDQKPRHQWNSRIGLHGVKYQRGIVGTYGRHLDLVDDGFDPERR